MSFSAAYVQKRTSKNTFYSQINTIIDWQRIDKQIVKYYASGQDVTGKPSHSGLLLFKMLLVGFWNGGLSDRDVEDMVNENLSAMAFCGLQLESDVPDHSCLSRFRSRLAANEGFESLLTEINSQMEAHGILVKTGVKIDASLTDSLRKPRGKATYQMAEDRKEDEVENAEINKQSSDIKAVRIYQKGVDEEGRWLKKAGKLHYGFKKHVSTDQDGLVLAVITTPANVHDSITFEDLVTKSGLKARSRVYADKAYKSKKHDTYLKVNKLKNGVHYKAATKKPLTEREQAFNKWVSKTRYTVERTFGSMSKWFGAGIAKYIGETKTHAQHLLEAMAYNLKRSPNLIIKLQVTQKQSLITG
jgi:transposase, IS5 family